MVFGRIDSQTRPARISVTESAKVSMSALECELEASETAAMPETARLRRTARSDAPPTRMGRARTSVSLLRTQSPTHSCRCRIALLHTLSPRLGGGGCGGKNVLEGIRQQRRWEETGRGVDESGAKVRLLSRLISMWLCSIRIQWSLLPNVFGMRQWRI